MDHLNCSLVQEWAQMLSQLSSVLKYFVYVFEAEETEGASLWRAYQASRDLRDPINTSS